MYAILELVKSFLPSIKHLRSSFSEGDIVWIFPGHELYIPIIPTQQMS